MSRLRFSIYHLLLAMTVCAVLVALRPHLIFFVSVGVALLILAIMVVVKVVTGLCQQTLARFATRACYRRQWF